MNKINILTFKINIKIPQSKVKSYKRKQIIEKINYLIQNKNVLMKYLKEQKKIQ